MLKVFPWKYIFGECTGFFSNLVEEMCIDVCAYTKVEDARFMAVGLTKSTGDGIQYRIFIGLSNGRPTVSKEEHLS